MLVVNDVWTVSLNMFQEDGSNAIIDIGISEGGDIFEVIYHPRDRDPIDLVGDELAIRAILIGFTAEYAHIMVSSVQGLRQAMRIGLHTAVGSGRIPVSDK